MPLVVIDPFQLDGVMLTPGSELSDAQERELTSAANATPKNPGDAVEAAAIDDAKHKLLKCVRTAARISASAPASAAPYQAPAPAPAPAPSPVSAKNTD